MLERFLCRPTNRPGWFPMLWDSMQLPGHQTAADPFPFARGFEECHTRKVRTEVLAFYPGSRAGFSLLHLEGQGPSGMDDRIYAISLSPATCSVPSSLPRPGRTGRDPYALPSFSNEDLRGPGSEGQ
jgi:hypothetical protein